MELNARRPTADASRMPAGAAGYRSPWYAGHECSHAPEPGPYRQWREARSDWVESQRPAVALAAEGMAALTAAVVLILGAAFAVILAVIRGAQPQRGGRVVPGCEAPQTPRSARRDRGLRSTGKESQVKDL